MAQRGTGQLRVMAPILLPGLWGGGDLRGDSSIAQDALLQQTGK